MPSWLVTGASRGLGYEFVRQLSQDRDNIVIGVVRNHKTSLPALHELEKTRDNLHILEADVTNLAALEGIVDEVKKLTGGTLDTLVNNAALASQKRGMLYELDTYPESEKSLLEQDLLDNVNVPLNLQFSSLYSNTATQFKINVIGVIKVINTFLPLVRAAAAASGSARVITLNSGAGSVELTLKDGNTVAAPYSISKTALLQAIAKYAVKYKKENIVFLSISPGIVDTSTENPTPEEVEARNRVVNAFKQVYPDWSGLLTPEESISLMLNIFKGLTIKDTGRFISHRGNSEDWL